MEIGHIFLKSKSQINQQKLLLKYIVSKVVLLYLKSRIITFWLLSGRFNQIFYEENWPWTFAIFGFHDFGEWYEYIFEKLYEHKFKYLKDFNIRSLRYNLVCSLRS